MEENHSNKTEQTEQGSTCDSGPGGCKPKPKTRLKKILFLIIILAAAGIIIFKLASPRPISSAGKNAGGTCVSSDKGCCSGTAGSDSCSKEKNSPDSVKKGGK